uniref:Head fiber protein n=1 Tax=Salmonella phage vB_SEnST11_KE23 TaxID=3161174 RepID=A0AAU8GHU8_9CAUD
MATSGVAGLVYATKLIDVGTGKSVSVSDLVEGGSGYTLPAATTTTLGGVKKASSQADSVATDVAGLVTDFNALLAKLKTAGLMA